MSEPLIANPSPSENSTDDTRNDCSLGGAPIGREQLLEEARIVAKAVASVRQRHADSDAFVPVMDVVAEGLNPGKFTPAEYLEAVYCVAKYAAFMAPVRERILLGEAVAGGVYQM